MKEMFCVTCGYDFDESESFWEAIEKTGGNLPVFGYPLCPKCCPLDSEPQNYTGFDIGRNLLHICQNKKRVEK